MAGDDDLILEGLNVSAAKRRIGRASTEWLGPEGQLVFEEAEKAFDILLHYFQNREDAEDAN